MSDKIVLTADQVVSRKSGWVSYVDEHGTARKTRAKNVIVKDDTVEIELIGLAPTEETVTTAPKPSIADQIFDSQQTETEPKPAREEKKVASKAKKKAAKKNGVAGVRTIGGKSFDLSKYEKSKAPGGGTSYNNGDQVASTLAGKDLDAVYKLVASKIKVEESELRKKYKHLNPGMQRMNLGNRLRKVALPRAAR